LTENDQNSDSLDDFYGTLPSSVANALKIALAAKKQVDQTFRCTGCGKTQRVRAKIQDSTAALRAAELWTTYNLSRPAPDKTEEKQDIIFTRKVIYTCDKPEHHETGVSD
jgi:hypothetical protein